MQTMLKNRKKDAKMTQKDSYTHTLRKTLKHPKKTTHNNAIIYYRRQ